MSKSTAIDVTAYLMLALLALALGLTGLAGLLWVLEVGKAASWTMLHVFGPLLTWVAALGAVFAAVLSLDVIAAVRRRVARRKTLRAAMRGDA